MKQEAANRYSPEIQEVLNRLHARRAHIDIAIEEVKALAEPNPAPRPAPGPPEPTPIPDPTGEEPRKRRRRVSKEDKLPYKGMVLWRAAERLLRTHNRTMMVAEIVSFLQEGGLDLTSKNLDSNLAAEMARQPKIFLKVAPGTWKLNDGNDSNDASEMTPEQA